MLYIMCVSHSSSLMFFYEKALPRTVVKNMGKATTLKFYASHTTRKGGREEKKIVAPMLHKGKNPQCKVSLLWSKPEFAAKILLGTFLDGFFFLLLLQIRLVRNVLLIFVFVCFLDGGGEKGGFLKKARMLPESLHLQGG